VFKVSLSIGLTRVTPESRSLRALHDAADRAAYLAKQGGRNQIQCYEGDEVTFGATEDGLEDWPGRLEQALERGAFRLFCQEIRPLSQGQGAPLRGEVLLRMKGESGNLLLPGAFLPMAERYGLMARIDRWVVERVLSRQAEAELGAVALTVNLSAEALADEGFAEFVQDCLQRYPQEPERICFEFSELTLLTAFAQALRLLPALKAMGFSLSVERFGTGHASYGYIKALPVDYLKIDGELVRDMCDDPLNFTLVQSMNQIGHTLRKQTVAEAAEDERILSSLRDLGVDYAQGYAVARPQPLEEFGSYLM
jgi:EAL domain-containing protein (putative c-di-GMP-specific phosphodiesterase class I)